MRSSLSTIPAFLMALAAKRKDARGPLSFTTPMPVEHVAFAPGMAEFPAHRVAEEHRGGGSHVHVAVEGQAVAAARPAVGPDHVRPLRRDRQHPRLEPLAL
jgi:hypothetical protein